MSSTTARALARAEASAAVKKAQIQKIRSERESQSALELQRQELALNQRKLEEKARMETLRLEEEAEIAVTKAQAIDQELNLGEPEQIDLPEEDPSERTHRYVHSQTVEGQNLQLNMSNDTHHGEKELPTLNPSANVFAPQHPSRTPDPVHDPINPYIQFIARRELIANKLKKFDNNPQNYCTWRESFKTMIRGVNISPSEQLNLIIEHTTGESNTLAQRIRNAYIQKPAEGVSVLWQKLNQRFGSSSVVTQVHLKKLSEFPKVGFRDNKKLQELGDLLLELQCAKSDGGCPGLKILDEPIYIKPIIAKLPGDIQGRWQRYAYRYLKEHAAMDYPPFIEFSTFIQELSLERNNPNLIIDLPERDPGLRSRSREVISTKRTEVKTPPRDPSNWCLVHQKPHPLRKCRAFLAKPLAEKTKIVKENGVCFRCLASCEHCAKDCQTKVTCTECDSDKHLAALHSEAHPKNGGELPPKSNETKEDTHEEITTKCTELCGNTRGGKSCSKICLANVYLHGNPGHKLKAYVVIDDQSNSSLAKPELFDVLNVHGQTTTYSLKTCGGTSEIEGRCTKDLVVESLDGKTGYKIPNVYECNDIPDSRDEIPTPKVAAAYPHLQRISKEMPDICNDANILLLIGRNVPPLHKVHKSLNGPKNAPWAQLLDLGWVIVGNVCLNGAHKPDLACYRSNILENGRPCPNFFRTAPSLHSARKEEFRNGYFDDNIGQNVFNTSKDDNKPGQSIEDLKFASIMEAQMTKNAQGNWEAPLPFRNPATKLPDNRQDTLKRFNNTRKMLQRKPDMEKHYHEFMGKLLEKGHAEPVPDECLNSNAARWYLPHFGVYHPRKPGKICVVFDSAAETSGISLNKMLLSGPDLTNSLIGILLRFRTGPVAFTVDIEQMFHAFFVNARHRDFLRFFWYKENDPCKEVIEYRMKVHLFGNTSSPAVATTALRLTAHTEERNYGTDAREFVECDFYVDDGLKSTSNCEEAISLLKRTQQMLATANLRLHKVSSNKFEVAHAFPEEDRATELRNLDLHHNSVPVQRSLGVSWDLHNDVFTFQVADEKKPFTRRGVLSTTNSLYDPLGIAAPVVIKAKMLLRTMTTSLQRNPLDVWDKPLPEEYRQPWEVWRRSLTELRQVMLPRSYTATSLSEAKQIEVHTFSDASQEAIAAVSYLRIVLNDNKIEVSFLIGKAKLAPSHATTIPRLELCAAVLAVEITELVLEELPIKASSVTYYSDSKVILGYILNETRRFYVYVANRVQRIRKSSSPHQWRYVATDLNPATVRSRLVISGIPYG
ncbi:uncharacterized protein LOC114530488 [Dendronephthya gigantea]|uniref:uncharacterized protein LOC114530488 n=1 Tax=Dendronephthya gigantea TaxID=151771 RepID=UPI00106D0F97|nr:uncharacterized protein LOC114530488 [Dendronephthya gigantea]